MGGFWKKVKRKTAVALTASMLMTTVFSGVGLAGIYDLGGIVETDANLITDEYLASVSVALQVDDGSREVTVASNGEAMIELNVRSKIDVATVSVASGDEWVATSSNAVKEEVAEKIAGYVTVVASKSDVDSEIADYFELDDSQLNSEGILEASIKLDGGVAPGTYHAEITLTPAVDEGFYDSENLTVTVKPEKVALTVVVTEDEKPDEPDEPDEPEKEIIDGYQFFGIQWLSVPYGSTQPAGRLNFDGETIEKVDWTYNGDAENYLTVSYDEDESQVYFTPKKVSSNGYQMISLSVETDKAIYKGDVHVMVVNSGYSDFIIGSGNITLTIGTPVTIQMPKFEARMLKEETRIYSLEGLKAELSEDYATLILEAEEVLTNEELGIELTDENGVRYFGWITVYAVMEGASLNVETTKVSMSVGETVEIPVSYQPDTAKIYANVGANEEYLKVSYDETKQALVIRALKAYDEEDMDFEYGIRIRVSLWESDADDAQLLAAERVRVYIVESQLGLTGDESVEEILDAAKERLSELIEEDEYFELTPEIVKVVRETVDALANKDIEANMEDIAALEEMLKAVMNSCEPIVDAEGVELEATGAILNLAYNGIGKGAIVVKEAETPSGQPSGYNTKTLDIKLVTADGKSISLKMPMQIKIKVPGIDLNGKVRINHVKDSGTSKMIYPSVDKTAGTLVFYVDSFSKFVFMNYYSGSGSSSGGGGGGGSSTQSGVVPNLSGTWVQNATGWWFQLTSGGYPANQWGKINNHWYYFNADGYMLTGWIQVAGIWYYLQPSGEMVDSDWVLYNNNWYYLKADGAMTASAWIQYKDNWYYMNADGTMAVNTTTPDGYPVNADGIWVH